MIETVTPDAPHYVYTFRDEAGRELYVGCTGNVGRRIMHHASSQPWWPQVARIEATRYPDQRTALDAEREAIQKYDPANNLLHTERCDRGGWTARRRRMAEAHSAGYFCSDASCKTCPEEAHAQNLTCMHHYRCRICINFRPFWTVLSPEKRRAHPQWEPWWEDYTDHEPTWEEIDAWYAALRAEDVAS